MIAKDVDVEVIEAKYAEERQKRLRPDGTAQYVDVLESDKFKNFGVDPWAWEGHSAPTHPLEDGDHYKVVILGTGFAGILYGIHFLRAGFKLSDLLFVDRAGGFGGTWYWNRYPGIMCDVESYIYLPLLEETGYMPKHKYSYGYEIRNYANELASKYNLGESASFNTEMDSASWDEHEKGWSFELRQKTPDGNARRVHVRSDFFVLAPGLFTHPKLPGIPGIEDFKGHCFHTSRWDYAYTGGSPTDWTLDKLQDKRVAIIGTGATAIQAIPQLSNWAKQLYVVQRTPAGVDVRGQQPTDPEVWKREIGNKPGWQEERIRNFLECMSDPYEPPSVDMVDDAWSHFISGAVLTGGPRAKGLTMENLPEFLKRYRSMDLERQEKVRERVDKVVQDPEIAKSLKAWYASWCKRPCFHDDYLPTFNKPNVRLLDTQGAGLTKITNDGIIVNGEKIEVDVIVFSTGFEVEGANSPAAQAGIPVTGRNGLSLNEKWDRGVGTLHGITTRDFPNFFFTGTSQTLTSPNFMVALDYLAKHSVYIISTVVKKAEQEGKSKAVVEPAQDAEEAWAAAIAKGAISGAAMAGCTPSYYNRECELESITAPEELAKMMRKGIWSGGPLDFIDFANAWEKDGKLEGLEVSTF
ncbi:hypothetical protein AYO21_11328 [Fonsecaea monophora]|uniref:Uncharacterized protein n=1 Tax=Fonsecaea monophora TaxID=254056 RepID=A0A177ES84_9EURO|nr:hypothetical protein AYO21_11328 [Fonsecaea monophora]KAH0831528.1 Pentalenolactone D synthase [Fonsecaea pedrosoi]OAG34506.1 hypothetical protein AYO21_11328 [Fonsecaea monophora]